MILDTCGIYANIETHFHVITANIDKRKVGSESYLHFSAERINHSPEAFDNLRSQSVKTIHPEGKKKNVGFRLSFDGTREENVVHITGIWVSLFGEELSENHLKSTSFPELQLI